MVILIFFLLYWIGLSFRFHIIVFLIISAIVVSLVLRKYKWKLTLIALTFLLVGIGVSYINIDIKSDVYDGFVYESKDNYFLLFSKFERLYVYKQNNSYEVGDYLSISAHKQNLNFSNLESDFNFTEYLEKKGVRYQLNYKSIDVKFKAPIRIREGRNAFLSHFDENTRDVISSLMFSDGDGGVVKNNVENLHLSRLVNMSGIYIYVFLAIIDFLFSYLFDDEKWSRLCAIVVLVPYFIFTFPRFTIIRIFVLQIFRWFNKNIFGKKLSNFSILGITGLFFLLINPYLGYQDSFIIGFSFPIILTLIRRGISTKSVIKRFIVQNFLIYLLILPFEIKYYNGINPFLFPLQFVLTPFFLLLALLSVLCFYKMPSYNLCTYFLSPIEGMGAFFNHINISINAPPFNAYLILIYVLLMIALFYYRAIKFYPITKALYFVIASFLLIYFLPINNLLTESITFINVGQGDSCLIRKQNKTILIDTGGLTYKDVAKDSLIPFFKKQRIYHIDLVITTHGDYDHCGALDSLMENFYVKNVMTNESKFPVSVGDITINNYNSHISEYEDENDKSLVLGFSLMHKDFLIMGDAPSKVEKNIIKEYPDLNCDILKLGHHGSNTSTCDEFIKFTTPELAIISCGLNNKFHHPNKEVLDVLNNNHIPYRRTDYEGSITFSNYIFM